MIRYIYFKLFCCQGGWVQAALAAAQVAASVYSASQASKGQEQANTQGMGFNAEEAQKQRDWEHWMFTHRYQQTRQDLEAADYNPLLAFGSGPGTPSGAAAHFEPKSTTAESSKIFNEAARQASELALSTAMQAKTNAETRQAVAHASMAEQEADVYQKWPLLVKIRAVLNSLGGLGGLVGGTGVGLGQLLKGIGSASTAKSASSVYGSGGPGSLSRLRGRRIG